MLSTLSINNVALIKKQTVDFVDGFNCILGQSGAGKSIVIDALSFLLGAKTDKTLIRSGETQLRVDGVFNNLSAETIELLKSNDIDYDDELIVTRIANVDGKSSIKLNGFPVTAKFLKDLSENIIDFCGQHDSVGLLNVNNHLLFLDKFAGEEVELLKQEVSTSWSNCKDIEKKIETLGGSDFERERTKELLEYQIQEIDMADLKIGEEEELRERFEFISSAENIFDKVSEVINNLDKQRENVIGMLHEAKSILSGLSNFKDIEECRERIENSYYEMKDVVEVLEEVKQSTEFDPKELERIDNRLDLIKKLSKKYGSGIEEILKYKEKCQKQLDEIENSVFLLEKLEKEKTIEREKLDSLCEKLTKLRKEYAVKLQTELKKQLDDLEMKGSLFEILFEHTEPTKKGVDAVRFVFSANKGQEVKDLHKVASGGELSRLLLAFKNVMLNKENVQTVVFDEIDSGISGHIAGKLAEKLANISKYTQILCITHTPVVASKADNFLLVEKHIVDNNTFSTVKTLTNEESVVEVARLIDGAENVSETAVEHAKKLFENK